MITDHDIDTLKGWFFGRLPADWRTTPPDITVDRDEVIVTVRLAAQDLGSAGSEDTSPAETAGILAGRAKAFREETRSQRMKIAAEAEHRFGRKVSWGVVLGEGDTAHRELFTHVAVPVMTRLRQPQRQVLDTLVDAGVARSRSDALAWCVRLVAQHQTDWLAELRDAMSAVTDVRAKGPAA